mgnify:CR=1 FL=1
MTRTTSQGNRRHKAAAAAMAIQRVALNHMPSKAAAINAAVIDASSNLAFLELMGLALVAGYRLPHGLQYHLFKGGARDHFVMAAVF